ncbi:MAG: murein biosynthesis integral membrane protein MurJ [Deltaproteobacteria bacterium]|nr:murein biosynthesis integral membrane protein MurJ [Deltaproteobacteria bacterium]
MAAPDQIKITRAAGVTGFYTLLSRILGLVRDQVVAYLFGAGPAADAFFVAFRIPNLLRRLSAEGAMAAAFVPVYTQELINSGPEAARRTAGAAASVLAVILAGLSILGIVLAPLLVRLIAPGYAEDPAKFELTVLLTRIVFPYVFFISLATLLMSQLNALGHFAAPAAAPIALNVSIIAFALLVGPGLDRPAVALAVGVLVGGAAQMAVQGPPLLKRRAWPQLVWQPGLEAVRTMGQRMIPVLFGAGVYQVNLLVNTLLASLLAPGSVSFLYYADRLVQFPLGVFGVALGTAVLPSLSRQAALGQEKALTDSAGHGLRLALFIVLPSAVGLALLAQPVVSLIYQRGAFDAAVSVQTVKALWAYALGLPLAALAMVVIRVFNALNDTRTPALVGVWAVALNIALSLILMRPLAHAGLALASSLATGFNLLLLLRKLYSRAPCFRGVGLFSGLGRTLVASAGLAALLALGFHWPGWLLEGLANWLKVVIGVLGGAGAYFVLAWALKSPELKSLLKALARTSAPDSGK